MAAWAGQPRALSTMLLDAPWSLAEQAYRPREMQHGRINVDGTGLAWWDPADRDGPPLRLATPAPPWADSNLTSLTPRLRSHLQIAAVRSATIGIPFGQANVAPFVHAGHAFSHNGFVEGYRAGTGRALLERVDGDLFDAMGAVSDSLTVFMLVLTRLRTEGSLVGAVQATVSDVTEVCRTRGCGATLNVLVADGTRLVAVRTSVDLGLNSLYARTDDAGTCVCSEPLDTEPGWESVPGGTGLVVDAEGPRPFALAPTTV